MEILTSKNQKCVSNTSLYEVPGDPPYLGPVAIEREIVRRLPEGILGVQETVPYGAVPPTFTVV